MNIEESEITKDTSIIVMLIDSGDKAGVIGGLVDSVKQVIEITPEMIQEAPKVGSKIKSNFISGIAKAGDKFVIILDIKKVLNDDQLALADDENLLIPEQSEEEGRTNNKLPPK